MFVIPVMYNNEHLCSYVPVLYLDSWLGVVGGLYYGLRKEYHPEMKTNITNTTKSWFIKDIIESAFVNSENDIDLPDFYKESFERPFVTVSYFMNTEFYTADIYPTKV